MAILISCDRCQMVFTPKSNHYALLVEQRPVQQTVYHARAHLCFKCGGKLADLNINLVFKTQEK